MEQYTYQIPITTELTLEGTISIPEQATGIVLFVHGSGSSRYSPRNQFVAQHLQQTGIATCLTDLFTPQEEEQDRRTGHLRFNIELLSQRVATLTQWLSIHEKTNHLQIGLFGASAGAAAALVAAAQHPFIVRALVSRGGRPDLASKELSNVKAPTLLLVGAQDTQVIELNHIAHTLLHCEKHLEIVPGASHLFEEEGTLEVVAQLASQWFLQHFSTQTNVERKHHRE